VVLRLHRRYAAWGETLEWFERCGLGPVRALTEDEAGPGSLFDPRDAARALGGRGSLHCLRRRLLRHDREETVVALVEIDRRPAESKLRGFGVALSVGMTLGGVGLYLGNHAALGCLCWVGAAVIGGVWLWLRPLRLPSTSCGCG